MTTITEIKKNRKAWVKALRSGKYKQTKSALVNGRGDAYCCLGVAACALFGVTHQNAQRRGRQYLTPEELKALGLSREQQAKLARANDGGKEFVVIATMIEAMEINNG